MRPGREERFPARVLILHSRYRTGPVSGEKGSSRTKLACSEEGEIKSICSRPVSAM
jgi:hypothetical protein